MSEVKVNKVSSRTGNAVTLGNTSDTLTVPSDVTITAAGTVSGNFKDIQWQSVITADGSTTTTAEAGKGYIIDTSSATHTINLPSSPSAGDTVAILNSGENDITVGRNSNNIKSETSDVTVGQDGAMTLVYSSSASIGWLLANQDSPGTFTQATGGTETTDGNFKVHTFTSSGCFVVSGLGNGDTNPLGGPSTVEYLVVAGGGGGNTNPSTPNWAGGGGGAGGYRTNYPSPTGLTVTAQTYPVTVGAGSTESGSNSVFSTITSAGGGHGAYAGSDTAEAGGSGGGGGAGGASSGAAGNTPPVSPPQGNSGGNGDSQPGAGGNSPWGGGGGGGASTGGSNGPSTGGDGGAGSPNAISGTATTYAGGGGGGSYGSSARGSGGAGGGGLGAACSSTGTAGSTNTGGGGGGHGGPGAGSYSGQSGGSGIVIIRYKYQ